MTYPAPLEGPAPAYRSDDDVPCMNSGCWNMIEPTDQPISAADGDRCCSVDCFQQYLERVANDEDDVLAYVCHAVWFHHCETFGDDSDAKCDTSRELLRLLRGEVEAQHRKGTAWAKR